MDNMNAEQMFSFIKMKLTTPPEVTKRQFRLNVSTVKIMEILILLFSVALCSATGTIEPSTASTEQFNCRDVPKESYNYTCFKRPNLFTNFTLDIAINKSLDHEAANTEKYETYRRSGKFEMFDTCIYYKFILETAGYFVDEKFVLENFKEYIQNISDLANYVDKTVSYFEKCVNLADEINVKKIQENFGIKLEDCNFVPKYVITCMGYHFRAVSYDVTILHVLKK